MRAALAFAVKDRVTAERIEARDAELLERAFARWRGNPAIEILGNPDPAKRLAIVSFNIKVSDDLYLHPKFVTALLNDLFGVQSRAGCACAGPYGHRLLDIDTEMSEKYRAAIKQGNEGVKPGWCRVGFHYTMDDAEAGFLIDAVDFVAKYGSRFLDLYDFDLKSGLWTHKEARSVEPRMYTEAAWRDRDRKDRHLPPIARKWLYRSYLRTAERWAKKLDKQHPAPEGVLPDELQELQFFSMKGALSG